MLYFWDFIFIVCYLVLSEVIFRIQDKRLMFYLDVRRTLDWVQFMVIVLYLYLRPLHTMEERAVSFGMFFITKIVFDLIVKKNGKIWK